MGMSADESSRRDFLKTGAVIGAGFLIHATGCAAGLRNIQINPRNGRLTVDSALYEELAAVGGAVQIMPSPTSDPLILTRSGASTFHALSSVCTHLGCRVRANPSGFRCPCHGSAFDFTGAVVNGPANEPLPVYAVTVEGTVITIDLT
jgi:thiosulfate dehydrogenase [quinone] large subunit